MAHKTLRLAAVIALFTLLGTASWPQLAPKAAAHWQGEIQIPEKPLAITVDMAKTASGAWIGSMTVVGSTSVDVPLSDISVEGPAVRFTAPLPGRTSFTGDLSPDANTLAGKVANAQGQVGFHLARAGEPAVKLPPPSTPLTRDFEGTWEGSLDANGKSLRVLVKLATAPDGRATGTLVSVDQGSMEIPISTVTIKGKELHLEARAGSGTYQGTLGASGEITGEWTQGPGRLPLILKRACGERQMRWIGYQSHPL